MTTTDPAADQPGPVTTPHGSAHEGRPDVVARYPDLVAARHAIERLEASGIDGDDITLVGRTAVEAEHVSDRERTDSRMLSSVGRALTIGILAGAAVGAVIGAVVIGAVLLFSSGLSARGWVFGLLTTWFAAGGAIFGAFAAISRETGFSESWPLTFEDAADGDVWLAVYGRPEEIDATVEATGALEVLDEPGWETTHPDLATATATAK